MVWPDWIKNYRREDGLHDGVASLILLVLLVPQSIAYAVLAGLPAQSGLLASIFPVLAYAWLGSSPALAVGPAALPSLMTASVLFGMALPGSTQYIALAAMLALASGVVRLVLAGLRFGFLANFLSQAVIGGFVTGSAMLIVTSQIAPMLGVAGGGSTLPTMLGQLQLHLPERTPEVGYLTLFALVLLWFGRRALAWCLRGMTRALVRELLLKAWPVAVIVLSAVLAGVLHWQVPVVGGLQVQEGEWWAWPNFTDVPWAQLWPGVLAIALVGFVDSMSIAESLAMKRRETVDPQRELKALGAANVVAGLTGGYPVSASFGRSAANHMAGVRTPLAGVLSAVWMVGVLVFSADLFAAVPLSVLSATIVVAVGSLMDWSVLRLAWRYDRRDALVYIATLLGVLWLGVLDAILLGMGLSLLLVVWRTSRPHMAVVGRVPGTEHFRNVDRHTVETTSGLLLVRVDESFNFANIRQICRDLTGLLASPPDGVPVRHLVLLMSAVNGIDVSALQTLLEFNRDLRDQGVVLHLAEVKGPVMDALAQAGCLSALETPVFLSAHQAVLALSADQKGAPAL